MPTNLGKGDKKKALAAYKDKLLTEIFYYDKRIAETRSNTNKSSTFEEYASSDSDSELSLFSDTGPPLHQLKSQHAMLKTCLQATQELTNLEVLQSEVNVLIKSPVFEGESSVPQPGTWQEVTAECCVDLVPFTITFYAHHGLQKNTVRTLDLQEGKFAPILYRGLKVSPLKASHEAELVKSVLPGLKRPSDAVEVLRSYAVAHRSRRSSLARLADKFGAALFMEPLPTGGYQLKCANLLEISWTLQNKWSPIAPFHHRLKFDIEYMDESYIKTITSCHRQLSDPSVDTDERTLLLAKIISTCLTARPLQETSDQESQNMDSPVKDGGRLEKRRTTLDQEPDPPYMNRNKDSEVMAPPKSLPKKVKPKNKSPSDKDNKTAESNKRPVQEEPATNNTKKAKLDDKEQNPTEENRKTEPTAKNTKTAASDKNIAHNVHGEKNTVKSSDGDKAKSDGKIQRTESASKTGKTKIASKKPANSEKPNEDTTKKNEKETVKNTGAGKKDIVANVPKNVPPLKRKSLTNLKPNTEQLEKAKLARKSAPSTNKKGNNEKNTVEKNEKNKEIKSAKKTDNDNIEKPVSNKVTDGNVIKIVKNITNEKGDVVKKVVKKLANNNPKVLEKVSIAKELKTNLPKKTISDKVVTSEGVKKTNANTDKKKPLNDQNTKVTKTINKNTDQKEKKNSPKVSIFPENSISVKKTATRDIEKENTVQNKVKNSKIPQKKVGTPKSVIKKMTVRVSPRKSISKAKAPLAGVNLKKILQKPVTGIPRLLTKPKPKVM